MLSRRWSDTAGAEEVDWPRTAACQTDCLLLVSAAKQTCERLSIHCLGYSNKRAFHSRAMLSRAQVRRVGDGGGAAEANARAQPRSLSPLILMHHTRQVRSISKTRTTSRQSEQRSASHSTVLTPTRCRLRSDPVFPRSPRSCRGRAGCVDMARAIRQAHHRRGRAEKAI
jgi:hypothetical protein